MTAANYDFRIEQGATFDPAMTWRTAAGAVRQLAAWDARMHVRAAISDVAVVLNLTKANGKIILADVEPNIVLLVSAAETAALTLRIGVYDLELIEPGGVVHRLLQGKVNVSAEVTR